MNSEKTETFESKNILSAPRLLQTKTIEQKNEKNQQSISADEKCMSQDKVYEKRN